jgi:hypothetical protein
MITTCLTLAGMIGFVLFPLFIPISVHAVDAVLSWRRTSAAARTAGLSRLTPVPRFAVAAA